MKTISQKMCTATVAAVSEEGLKLIFPDGSDSGEKRYKYNKGLQFSVGDRVFLIPSGSTYVVAFPI